MRPYISALSPNWVSIRGYLSLQDRWLLIVIFSILYLPHVFILNTEFSLISALEVDSGSILTAIDSLFSNHYNLNIAYHSKYYGWTYYAINFIALMPVYIAYTLGWISNKFFMYFGVRSIIFIIGLCSVLAFYEVGKKTLGSRFLAVVSAFLYMTSPSIFRFFFYIKPETTGLLFLLLGILSFLKFDELRAVQFRYYFIGLSCLVLSALSKQLFFFTALPVLLWVLNVKCAHTQQSVWKYLLSREFYKALLYTTIISILIFFLIHPYAFIEPQATIGYQLDVLNHFTSGQLAMSREESAKQWMGYYLTDPIVFASLGAAPLAVVPLVFSRIRKGSITFAINALSVIAILTLIAIANRVFVSGDYLAPVYPFCIFSIMGTVAAVGRWKVKGILRVIRFIALFIFAYFIFFSLAENANTVLPTIVNRLLYRDTITYKVYSYIERYVPAGSRVVHDHVVPIPSNRGFVACHYWQGCGEGDYIEEFKPDYVIFDERFTVNGHPHGPTLRLEKYVRDHHFDLVGQIEGYAYADESNAMTISVWKRHEGSGSRK